MAQKVVPQNPPATLATTDCCPQLQPATVGSGQHRPSTGCNRIPSRKDQRENGMLLVCALANLAASTLYAQHIASDCRGIPKASPQETRQILRIAKKEDGAKCASRLGNLVSPIPLLPLPRAGDCARE